MTQLSTVKDDDDRITEVRIHHRTLPALLAFSAEMDGRVAAT